MLVPFVGFFQDVGLAIPPLPVTCYAFIFSVSLPANPKFQVLSQSVHLSYTSPPQSLLLSANPALLQSREVQTARFAEVILPLPLPQTLTYAIPLELQGKVAVGMRVEVQLRANKLYTGLVVALHNRQPEGYDVKVIRDIIDDEPIINDTQLKFWSWIAKYYLATPGEVMQAALPAHLKIQSETRLLWTGLVEDSTLWTEEGWTVFEALQIKKELTVSELRTLVGGRHLAAALHELIERGAALVDESLQSAYKPKMEKVVQLAAFFSEEEALRDLFEDLNRAPKQLELLLGFLALQKKGGLVRQADLLERTGASATAVKALTDKGVFEIEEIAVDRLARRQTGEPLREIHFTPAQATAYEQLTAGLKEKKAALLQGVTGSGKTLLYLQKIRDVLATGRQAIFLLPEIGLTTQLVSRLYAYFGKELGVYHSRFSDNERVEIWDKVRTGEYKIVVGPRSALWLPYSDLGVIIVDEEHDLSYKQKDPAPRFHARDAAVYLAHLHGAEAILGSATPSVESLYNAKSGKYALVQLQERYQGVNLPVIELINAGSIDRRPAGGSEIMTPELIEAIKDALGRQRQVILFQNRRGYNPFLICTDCGFVPHCRNCSVSLTYHKSTDKLHCHYCSLKTKVLQACPQCGSHHMRSRSFGTEKIEEEAQRLFPAAKVARMDVDSTRGKNSMSELLDKMQRQQIDILVGTQMVVKGLDFAPVALVGILSADGMLSFPDFRVAERAFQLMEQVSGRAGRADGKGRVIIQTYNPAHPVLGWVQAHDVEAFYQQEIGFRKEFNYPPFSRLIKICFKHVLQERAAGGALAMAEALARRGFDDIQGPVPAMVARVRNQYVLELWIRCPRDRGQMEALKAALKEERSILSAVRGNSGLGVHFDVDPA